MNVLNWFIADGGFTHEEKMNLQLITIPTYFLGLVTIISVVVMAIDNKNLVDIIKMLVGRKSKTKNKTVVQYGRHEAEGRHEITKKSGDSEEENAHKVEKQVEDL